jgi:hypothetical protein
VVPGDGEDVRPYLEKSHCANHKRGTGWRGVHGVSVVGLRWRTPHLLLSGAPTMSLTEQNLCLIGTSLRTLVHLVAMNGTSAWRLGKSRSSHLAETNLLPTVIGALVGEDEDLC